MLDGLCIKLVRELAPTFTHFTQT